MKTKSFTLIELLVVIVIIGILSSVIIISVSSGINKANFAKAQSFSSTVQTELLSNLVSEWTFDNASNIGEDSWGNNDGTVYGSPVLATKDECVYGTCLTFDGVDDYIQSRTDNSLIISTYTITGWVKIPLSPGTSNRYMFSLGSGVPSFSPNFWTANKPLLFLSTGNYKYGSTNLANNAFSHIVFVVDGLGLEDVLNSKIYVNGTEESYSSIRKDILPIASSGKAIIGGYSYKGLIDDVRIYNIALSSAQIKQEYIAGLNSLLANGNISKEEYNQRLNTLAMSNY